MGKLQNKNPDFLCGGCNGDIVEVGQRDGRKDFNCSGCGKNLLRECVVCHLPRSAWGDNGNVCHICTFRAMTGEIILSKEQIGDISKWMIDVRLPIRS